MAESCGPRCPRCGGACALPDATNVEWLEFAHHAHGHFCFVGRRKKGEGLGPLTKWPLSEEEQVLRALSR